MSPTVSHNLDPLNQGNIKDVSSACNSLPVRIDLFILMVDC